MACPTCDHTMEAIQADHWRTQRWCPRCGTLVVEMKGYTEATPPKLVERCRKYEGEFDKENIAQFYRNTWKKLGVHEAIHTPEYRT